MIAYSMSFLAVLRDAPHLSPLSAEHKAVEEYVADAIKLENIHLSTTPASGILFCVQKKAGGLQSCSDYNGLNQAKQ